MKKYFYFKLYSQWLVLILSLMLIASGCVMVKFVADYDETTDKQVTELYKTMMAYMQDIANTPRVTGSDSTARASKYSEISQEIGVLKLRATAKEKNDQQIQQVGLLADSWNKVGILQTINPTKEMILNAQSGLEITLTAILKLEIAKKRS